MRQGWEIKRLGEIGTFQRGGGFLKSDYVEDGFPCIHYGQIHTRFGVKTLSHLTCIPKQLALSKSKIAHKGDIVIAITSEDVEGSCKCTAWMGDYDVAVGGHAAIFRHNLNPAFVAYYFRGAYFQTAKTVFAHGSKVVEIKPNDIATIKIAYPSLPEQEKIVAELDCLSGIIEKKKQQLKEYDALAQSIFYEMFGNPIDNEKGWDVKKLGEEFEISSGGTPDTKNTLYWEDGDISWIGSNMCHNDIIYQNDGKYITNEGLEHSSAKMYQDGYVIVALVGATIGKTALLKFPTTTNQNVAGINVPSNRNYTSEYVFYLIQNLYELFHSIGNGKFKMANLGFVRSLPLVVPPLALQQEFASKIDAIEKQKELIKQSIAETETLFNSRMDYYFN